MNEAIILERTHWKSTMLVEKLNPLRVALNLPPKDVPLERTQYDKQVVDTLRDIDFSELDTNCCSSWFCCIGLSNVMKYAVLTFVGLGREPDIEQNLIGDASNHEN
jgi:hypothetical protein